VDKNVKNGSVSVTQAKNKNQGICLIIRGKWGKKVVAGVGFEPTTSGL
jgi:hypothetical protein